MGSSRMRQRLSALPLLTAPLTVGSIVCTGLWYHFTSKALNETKAMITTMKMQMPKMFSTMAPGFLTATVIVGVLIPLAALLVRLWRSHQQTRPLKSTNRRPYMSGQGAANGLLYILNIWLAIAFGISILWFAVGMVMAKSTLDAADTLADVDPAIHNLIRRASGGIVDPAKSGFYVNVGNPKRVVDIGKTSCGLFCFVMARAFMSESMECTCNAPIMRDVHVLAEKVYHTYMQPALVCCIIALLCTLGLLMTGVGNFSAAKKEQRVLSSLAPGSGGSTDSSDVDASMQVDQTISSKV